jgi:hypothetical protein
MSFQGWGSIAYAYPWPVKGVLGGGTTADGVRQFSEFEFLTGFGGAELARAQTTSTIGIVALLSIALGLAYYQIQKLKDKTREREEQKEELSKQ